MRSTHVALFRHTPRIQSSVFISHSTPSYPKAQRQLYPFTASRQVAPFWQGLLIHSSMFVSQLRPVYPGLQETHQNETICLQPSHTVARSPAFAVIVGYQVCACCSIQTWMWDAVIDIDLTHISSESSHTLACIVSNSIHARGTIHALIVDAVINVGLTQKTRVAMEAAASERRDSIHTCTIVAGKCSTVVDVHFTVLARESQWTRAVVIQIQVGAISYNIHN